MQKHGVSLTVYQLFFTDNSILNKLFIIQTDFMIMRNTSNKCLSQTLQNALFETHHIFLTVTSLLTIRWKSFKWSTDLANTRKTSCMFFLLISFRRQRHISSHKILLFTNISSTLIKVLTSFKEAFEWYWKIHMMELLQELFLYYQLYGLKK